MYSIYTHTCTHTYICKFENMTLRIVLCDCPEPARGFYVLVDSLKKNNVCINFSVFCVYKRNLYRVRPVYQLC